MYTQIAIGSREITMYETWCTSYNWNQKSKRSVSVEYKEIVQEGFRSFLGDYYAIERNDHTFRYHLCTSTITVIRKTKTGRKAFEVFYKLSPRMAKELHELAEKTEIKEEQI